MATRAERAMRAMGACLISLLGYQVWGEAADPHAHVDVKPLNVRRGPLVPLGAPEIRCVGEGADRRCWAVWRKAEVQLPCFESDSIEVTELNASELAQCLPHGEVCWQRTDAV